MSADDKPKPPQGTIADEWRRLAWYLAGMRPDPAALPVATPAAETRSAEDYEDDAWDDAFRAEVGAITAAQNAKWAAYGRGEHVPGARPVLGMGRGMGMGGLTDDEREALHGARPRVTLTDAGEPCAQGETSMYINDVNRYAPPGGKLLRSDVEADGTIRHTFSTGEGLEVSCAIMAPHDAGKERECLEAFKAEHDEQAEQAADDAAAAKMADELRGDMSEPLPLGSDEDEPA